MRPRVFALEPYDKLDLTPAEGHGHLVYLFPPGEGRPGVFDPAFADCVLDRLEDLRFDPRRDHLLVAGSMVGTCLTVALLTRRYVEPMLLLWDARDKRYVSVKPAGEPAL